MAIGRRRIDTDSVAKDASTSSIPNEEFTEKP